eukprot:2168859-Amphidinium_carterae.1
MEDSRLLQQYEQVRDALSEEQQYLEELDYNVWECLSKCVCIDAMALRHKTLKAVHMAVAYCDWRVFEPLHAYPFRLCLGSIRDN